MLQIIGWLGCLYLVLKGCEFLGSKAYRDADGEIDGYANTGAVLSIVGAAGFALWLFVQGGQFATSAKSSFGSSDYTNIMNVDENLTTTDLEAINADKNAR